MRESFAQRGSRPRPDAEEVSDPPPLGGLADMTDISTSDSAAADAARAGYRRASMATLDPDDAIAPLLCPGERLRAVRRGAVLELREQGGLSVQGSWTGDLYLTSRRLVLVAQPGLSVELDWIQDILGLENQLLLTLGDGSGLRLVVDRPSLLRVQISAARTTSRRPPPARTAAAGAAAAGAAAARAVPIVSFQAPVATSGLGPVPDSELVEEAADVGLDRPR